MKDEMDSADVSRGIEEVPVTQEANGMGDSNDFVYVRCNIPGPSISRAKFHEQFEGCSGCLPDAHCLSDCVCITRCGRRYDDQRQLLDFDPYANTMRPVYECNKECRCAASCFNRVVQRGVQVPLQVFRTEAKGLGLRARENIPQNRFVCEYAGEILSLGTARKRIKTMSPEDCNYIIVVKEHIHSGEVIRTIVDPTYIGNVGRFINHSCEPNLYMLPIHVNNSIPHVALFALREIEAGEELTFDYSGEIQKPEKEAEEEQEDDNESGCGSGSGSGSGSEARRESVTPVTPINIQPGNDPDNTQEVSRKPCHCGAAKCRGFLPFDETLFNSDTK